MSRKTIFCLAVYLLIIPLFILPDTAQGLNETENNELLSIREVTFSISGTSNVRDWEVSTETMTGTIRIGPGFGKFDAEQNNTEQWFEEITLSIPNETLDSGISVMNSTMHDHLMSEEYPEIGYRLLDIESVQSGNYPAERKLILNGIVTAAGTDHNITHDVALRQEGNEFIVSGELDLKITDFDIKPPTFMRGALKTADEMTVSYRLILTR